MNPDSPRSPERELGDRSAGNTPSTPPLTRRATDTGNGNAIWIGVGVVFALMALAWAAMFFFASKYSAASVPVAPREAR